MKTYLVGGAVRDYLLGLPVTERDWVVVGAEPEDLLAEGYRPVGRDFPVFLHPTTREEYALARTETKRGMGYHGFVCNAGSQVTLEQDLARRDLTINAMAMDSDGRVIDPFNGQADLRDKRLRHVAPAFVEDPVRVLRVARFTASLHYLGFELAPETHILMQRMGRAGELDHLIAERVWREWQKSLTTKNPELFISTLRSCGALSIVLPELDALFGVPNLRQYHPEVDTGIHALMALTVAAKLSDDPVVRFASLLHDIGKQKTPMQTWPVQDGHEVLGLPIISALCQRLHVPKRYQHLAELAARWHGDMHAIRKLSASAIVDILDHIAAWQRADVFEQLLLVCEADAKGRWILSPTAQQPLDYPCSVFWRTIRTECHKLRAQTWVAQGLAGQAIKDALYAERLAQVCTLRKQWGFDEVE